jgi:NitT/TauT family transport system permease protein
MKGEKHMKNSNKQKIFIIVTLLLSLVALFFLFKNFFLDIIKYQINNDTNGMNEFIKDKGLLAPILIIWVGANIKGIVVVSISISLVITVINALNAFNNIDSEKIKLFKTFEATKLQILRYLILPATLNDILNIIRINIGMSWIGVIVGEFIVSKKGLGYLITYGTQVFRLDIVMMGIVTLSVVTMLMYKILNLIAKIIKRNNRI